MTRPRKQTVDYFPHSCNHGQTMFIIEQRYGNDGYTFWFKLLEMLGRTPGHFLDLEKIATLEFLASTTRIQPDNCLEILNLLARLEAIDPELWESKIIWSDNFVEGITDAYRNRVLEIPKRPDNLRKKPHLPPQSGIENPQTKLEESKVPPLTPPQGGNGKRQIRRVKIPANFSDDFERFWAVYPNPKGGKEKAWEKWQVRLREKRLPPIDYLLQSVEKLAGTYDWQKEGGIYIPMITTFINQGRWTDADAIKSSPSKIPPKNRHGHDCPKCKGTMTCQSGKMPDGSPAYRECDYPYVAKTATSEV